MKEHPRAQSWHVMLLAPPRRLQLPTLIWYLVVLALRFVPGVDRHMGWYLAFALLSGVVASSVMDTIGRGKFGRLELSDERIVCGPYALWRSRLRSELQIWKDPYLHTTLGTALVLYDAEHRLCIGGKHHLLHSTEGRATVEHVDASLSDADFSELLHALGVSEARAQNGERALAIELVPSTASLRGVLQVSAPWFAAMLIVVLLGAIGSALHFERNLTVLFLVEGMSVPVTIAGAVLTVRRGSRPLPARYRLLLEPQRLLLEDRRAKPDRADRSGPPLRATRHFYRSTGRFGSVEIPTLCLTWPNGKKTIIGVWNTSIRWAGKVPRLWRLQYVIGPEEWRRVTSALGLH